MAMKSGSLDYWRDFFRTANSDIFNIIDHALMVAASDCPKEFRLRRDRIAELLFSCRMTRCTGCDRVELAVPEQGAVACKSGDEGEACENEADGSKESKANSCRDDHGELNMNPVSNCSYGDAEALTDEMEEENQIIGEVLRIKDILCNSQDVSDAYLFDSLRRLQLMALSVDILKATEIGRAVNRLRKHASKDIRLLARTLIHEWKDLVDEWVNATKAIAESTPDSVNPSVVEEEEEEEGLPDIPLDEGAFFATQPIELSQFFDGMDDDGNPRNTSKHENERKPSLENQNIMRQKQQPPSQANMLAKEKSQQMKNQEATLRPIKPSQPYCRPGRPPEINAQKKFGNETKPQQVKDSMQRRPVSGQQNCSDEVAVQRKLEATKRKLHESYQQAENAKKQRTIQVMELRDLPKQGLARRNPFMKPGNQNSNWGNGRRQTRS